MVVLLIWGLPLLFIFGNNLTSTKPKIRQFGTLLGIITFAYLFCTGHFIEPDVSPFASALIQLLISAFVTAASWTVLPLVINIFDGPFRLIFSVLKPVIRFIAGITMKPFRYFQYVHDSRQELQIEGLEFQEQNVKSYRENLRFDLMLEHKALRNEIREILPESEFAQLIDEALKTSESSEVTRRTNRLRQLLRSYSDEIMPETKNLESIAKEFKARRADIDAADYEAKQRKKLHRWLDLSEEMRIQRHLQGN